MTSLRVLVCSANLGNAEPDQESIQAWLPTDGSCREHLESQGRINTRTNASSIKGRFDLVVLGLQEAVFEEGEDEKEDADFDLSCACTEDITGSTSQFGNAALCTAFEPPTPPSSRRSLRVMAKKVSQIPFKGTSAIHGLMTTRDHTKDPIGMVENGTTTLHQLFQDRLPSYQRILSFQRGQMRILVYKLKQSKHSIHVKSVRAQNTGRGGLANKGGIVAEVIVDETTTMTFVSCHLEAHEGIDKYKTRVQSLENILQGTKQFASPPIHPDVSLASHYCFLMGDLNFRTRLNGRIHLEEQWDDVHKLVQQEQWEELNQADELRKALENHECLHGFQTLDCNFPPTFKLERHQGYHYLETRTPSYTDRILWKTGNLLETNVTPLSYGPIHQFSTSDHKPIQAAFDVRINQSFQLPPKSTTPHTVLQSLPWYHANNNETENLHLYLSDIQMDIFPNASDKQSPPDSYISMVTNPQELLLPPKTIWQNFLRSCRAAFCCQDLTLEDEFQKVEWPRTRIIPKSNNPDWKDDEVHCQLRGHFQDGTSIPLGGALLHLFAFGAEEELFGSFSVNLEYLYRACLEESFDKSLLVTEGMTVHETATPKMVSLDIAGPLLRNGIQTGILRCSLDAWWVKDTLAQAAKAHFLAKGLASNDSHMIRNYR